MFRWLRMLAAAVACVALVGLTVAAVHAQIGGDAQKKSATTQVPSPYGVGRPATPAEIAKLDIDVSPDGRGLPDGRGTPSAGERVYAARCAVCHGKTVTEGPQEVLVGREPREGFPFGRDPAVTKTIGNYWPYATTLFDYVRRAMPANEPGSLGDDEVYNLVAYLLFRNEIIPVDAAIDRASLPKVVMPARDRFVVDPRGGPKQRP